MAFVVFALGVRPALSEAEARELAEVVGRRRSIAAQSAAGKIQRHLAREGLADAAAVKAEPEIELDDTELQEVAAVLAEPRAEGELERFEHLRNEIKGTRGF